MSASKEKKNRSDIRSAGQDKKAAAAAEKTARDRKFKRNTIIVVVVLIIAVALAAVINSSLLYTGTTAVSIGGTDYTPAELSYFFRTTFNNIYSGFGDYASILVNPSTPLDQQQYSASQTWADYVYDQTIAGMKEMTALYDEAMSKGYTLTENDQSQIDSAMSMVSYYAEANGYRNGDGFLEASYGRGFDEATYKDVLTRSVIAGSYSTQISESFEFSAEELEADYAENKADYDYYTMYAYSVSESSDKFADVAEDKKAAAAHDAAAKIAAAESEEEFKANAAEFAGADTQVSANTIQGAQMSSVYKDWVTDPARAAGDTTVIDSDGFSYAMMFVSRNDNDYYPVNTRHILIEAEADENGKFSDEAIDAARAEAERVYALWQEDPTEDNFAELAKEYSTDTGSNSNGGLYEGVYKKQFVPEYDDFLFNSDSKPGDSAIVYNNSSSYTGYHIVYYIGEGEQRVCDTLADNALRSDAYAEYSDALTADYAVEKGSGFKFASLK